MISKFFTESKVEIPVKPTKPQSSKDKDVAKKEKRVNRVSYSQFAMYYNCPQSWYLAYVRRKRSRESSIHLIFGTAMHTLVQAFLNLYYIKGNVEVDKINWKNEFRQYFKEEFQLPKNQLYNNDKDQKSEENGRPVCNVQMYKEFLQDGYDIIDELIGKIQNRSKYFPKSFELHGNEIPIEVEIKKNIDFVGFIDIVLKNKSTGRIKIIDLKTSGVGWNKWQKADQSKTSQVLLYKFFYANKFGVRLDEVDVEFLILKRRLLENGYSNSRIQRVVPPHGKISVRKVWNQLNAFTGKSFDGEGNFVMEKDNYAITPGPNRKNCKWCEFSNLKGGKCNGKVSDY